MINYDSIISAYNDKPTLMEWLKKVEEALKGASATSFSVNKKGNATISFQINFDDGTSLESGDIVLQQGEGVASAAIVNGHLILTLTNGDELDAGSVGAVSGFSIDGSQHLIVTYQDGTTNDLGAIFNGNVNISGDLSVSGKLENDNFLMPATAADRCDVDLTLTPLSPDPVAPASHETNFFHARVSNGKLNIVCAFSFKDISADIAVTANTQVLNTAYLTSLSPAITAKLFPVGGSAGVIGAATSKGYYVQDEGAADAVNFAPEIFMQVYKLNSGTLAFNFRFAESGTIRYIQNYDNVYYRFEFNFTL